MVPEEKSVSGIPISGALMIVALILGLVVIPQQPYQSSRPKPPDQFECSLDMEENVQARLWQDPFAAVMKHKDNIKDDPNNHKITHLAEQIIDKKKDEIVILGVMVPGGPYAEETEGRKRYRYAVLSALGELDYVPEDNEHIGYVTCLDFEAGAHKPKHLELMPYEWFELETSPQRKVLLLWLNDGSFSGTPLRKLSNLKNLLINPPNEGNKNSKETTQELKLEFKVLGPDNSINLKSIIKENGLTKEYKGELKLKFKILEPTNSTNLKSTIKEKGLTEKHKEEVKLEFNILGPADSTNLKSMIKENGLTEKHKDALKNVHVFSWAATVYPEILLRKTCQETDTKSVRQCIEKKCMLKNEKTLTFFRTIGSDKELTDLLVTELYLRIKGLPPGQHPGNSEAKNGRAHIALISEWDTVYGRNLPEAFKRSVADKCCPKIENGRDQIDWIHQFSYMRGIDDKVPGDANTGIKNSASSNKKETNTQKQDIERPVGRSQFDYLRRLALRLKHLDAEIITNKKGNGIQAIGVLGSDVYDKLLVFQAMHKLFPNVIFFTTDFDARLLHPDELKWTRNLVIASNFDLRLNKHLQKNTPPFRDNYQTSLFLSTKIAMGCKNMPIENNKWFDSPRIFEVGQSDAFVLRTETESLKPVKDICQIFKNKKASIHPMLPKYGCVWMHSKYLWLGFIFISLFFVALYIIYLQLWKNKKHHGTESFPAIALFRFLLIWFLILLVFLLAAIIRSQIDGGEPFEFFEGISIWPSEFLRFIAGSLSLYFLITGSYKASFTNKKLSDQFFRPQTENLKKKVGEADGFGKNKSKKATDIWEHYKKYTSWKKHPIWIYLIILSMIYYLMCLLIIKIFKMPFVPYRGNVSCLVDFVAILIFAVPLFIVLITWVVYFTICCRRLILNLSETGVTWPTEITWNISKKFKIQPSCADEWIGIQVIIKISETVSRFVYYPFIVILILLSSRLRYFDKWDMPLGLLIVIMLSLIYSIYCAVSLRYSARQARKIILDRLLEKHLDAIGSGKDALAKQIKIMSDAVRSIRKGAFVPFFEQPWVRAVALFLGGGGSLLALDYFPLLK